MESDEKEVILINEWQYEVFTIKGVEVYFSQENSNIKVSSEDLDAVLGKIPQKHRECIPSIYVVNYFCQDNPETKGKHLAKSSYVVLYPNAAQELQMVLTHEVGHVIWDKKLTPMERINFYSVMAQEVPVTLNINNEIDRHIFVLENFANCYQFFLCNTFDSKKYPHLYQFILSLF